MCFESSTQMNHRNGSLRNVLNAGKSEKSLNSDSPTDVGLREKSDRCGTGVQIPGGRLGGDRPPVKRQCQMKSERQ